MILKCNYVEMDQAEQKKEGMDLKEKKKKERKRTFTVTQMEKF